MPPVHPRVCGEQDCTMRGRPGRTAVHPRVCGEQVSERHALPGYAGGSSPRVRGTGLAERHALPVPRFIPACAGNSRG